MYDAVVRYRAWQALRAAHEEPEWPPEVVAAEQAKHELIVKHQGDLHWSRDTRRAVANLDRKISAWQDAVVEMAVTKGLLPAP